MAGIDVTPLRKSGNDALAAPERREQRLGSGKIRQRTLRFRLAYLVLACTLPMCVIAGAVVYHAYQEKRSLMERRVLETASALSMAVDQQLAGMQASATALATSPYLASGNFAAFQRQAQAVLRDYPGATFTLADATSQQLVNTFVPFGTPLPKRPASAALQRVFETGKPAVSNLIKGTLRGLLVGVEAPVIRDGRVVDEVAITVPAKHFDDLVSQQSIPPEWPAAILDGNGVLVARNRFPEMYVGRSANPIVLKRMAEGAEGTVEIRNQEGAKVFSMFHRSTESGWAVVIAIPKAVLMAGLRPWLWWTVGSAVLLSMIGIGLALLMAKRIAGSIEALITPAMALGAGEPVEIGPLDLAEADKVRQSLEGASQLLQQRTWERNLAEEALCESEERLRLLVQGAKDHAIFMVDPNGTVVSWNSGAQAIKGYTEQEIVGRNISCFYTAEDIEKGEPERLLKAAAEHGLVDDEGWRVRKDGSRFWAEVTLSALRDDSGKIRGFSKITRDITDHKRAEEERETTIEFLRLVNLSRGSRDLIQRATTFFQQRSACEAVGIRLQEGDDYPYFEYRGFSKEFVKAENLLCRRDGSGRVARDSAGNPALDCMCGNVIRGRFDSSKPFFTAQGSFWTNSTTELLATTSEADRQARTRNRCNGEGYESVALIALHAGEQRLGLLQLNDRRKGRFSVETILLWERLTGYLATALSKFRADEALQQSEQQLQKLTRTFRAVRNSNQALMHATDESAFLQQVCRIVTEDCGHAMVWIGFAENDESKTVRPVAHAGFEEGYLETMRITWDDSEHGRGPTGTAIRTGQPSMCRNMLTDPAYLPWREEAIKRGYASSLVVPLKEGDTVFGAITVYSGEPDAFSEGEVGLLMELAADLAYGISTLRMRAARAQAEEAVRRQADMLRLSFDAIVVWRSSGAIESWNRGAELLYGYSESEALGRVTHELLRTNHPEPWPKIEARLRGTGWWEGELHHFTKEGREVVVSARKQLLQGADGVERVLETNRDITEHRRAEERIAQLATYPELNANPILEVDLQGKVTYANPAAVVRFPEIVESGTEHPMLKEWPTVTDALRADSRQHVLTREVEAESAVFHQTIHLLSDRGVIRVYFADISERKRAEEALLRSEKLASVGRMAATIAHEINNPLEAVMNLLYLAKSAQEGESAQQYIDMADAELKRIAYITRQSLGFYRESNAPAPMAVNAVLDSAVDLLKSRIKAKRAVIEKQWDGEVKITAVAGELRQVFSNLLANSLDAIDEKGTIKLRVSTEASCTNSHRSVRITVADNGKGISASSRQHIFEPFFTTKGTVGTGLGLWVSKQIIEKHGGSIRMRSSSNGRRRGTAFSIVLPIEPAAAMRGQSAGD